MAFRPPQSLSQQNSTFNPLEYELASERADVLGRNGRKAEEALAMLASWRGESETERQQLVDKASEAVWALFIQREICGLRNSRDVVIRYQIPNEVLARLGAARR